MGFVFLWAFLHKTFGLVYATQSENAWISGSSPSRGLPVERRRRPAREHLLQLGRRRLGLAVQRGLAGIGVAVILGVGLRLAAVSGAIMTLMWAAEWPLAEHTSARRAVDVDLASARHDRPRKPQAFVGAGMDLVHRTTTR